MTMSDPLERLREPAAPPRAPDVLAIKVRARQLDSRRRLTIGAIVGSVMSGLVVLALVLALNNRPQIPPDVVQIPGPIAEPAGSPTPGTASPSTTGVGGGTGPGVQEAALARATQVTGPLRVTVDVSQPTVAQGQSVRLSVSACNDSSAPVARIFASGQRYEFNVRRGDEVVWRWSANRTFSQSTAKEI